MKKEVYEVWGEGLFFGSFTTQTQAVQYARKLYTENPKILYEIREGKA
ncbi:MAG: hypothetical protein LUC16_02130 [Coprobacillus sp.]|nr:hypothetical protein [Coprobacillus sp.]